MRNYIPPRTRMPKAVFQTLDLHPLKITPPEEAESSPYDIRVLKPKGRPHAGDENALF